MPFVPEFHEKLSFTCTHALLGATPIAPDDVPRTVNILTEAGRLRTGSWWGRTSKNGGSIVAPVGAVQSVQVSGQPHHERQLDLLLEEPAGAEAAINLNVQREQPHWNCILHALERMLLAKAFPKACVGKQVGGLASHLKPEFTMAAGMDRPRNAIRPLINPGKFCSAHLTFHHNDVISALIELHRLRSAWSDQRFVRKAGHSVSLRC